MSSN
ncbi:hypothetical protein F383_35615 [Gossypium arboreum]|jgi:hypothetical protein